MKTTPPTTYHVVTSFHPDGWNCYGRAFLSTFLEFWPENVRISVFLEGQEPPFNHPRVDWFDLKDDAEHEAFCQKWAGPEWNSKTDWNEMSVKFCHKVFAITSPKVRKAADWLIWIDADSETFEKVDDNWLKRVFPDKKILTYLGRTGMMRPGQVMYTETGFVGYNVSNCFGASVLHHMRHLYTSGDLFKQGRHNWHDGYTFDWARRLVNPKQETLHNLSSHCYARTMHVWPKTILGEKLVHNKGPALKSEAYGFIA